MLYRKLISSQPPVDPQKGTSSSEEAIAPIPPADQEMVFGRVAEWVEPIVSSPDAAAPARTSLPLLPAARAGAPAAAGSLVEDPVPGTRAQAIAELEALYATIPVGLGSVDTQLRYLHVNDHLAQITGLAAAAHLGQPMQTVMPELSHLLEPLIQQVIQSGLPVLHVPLHGPAADGSVQRDWRVSCYPLKDETGRVLSINLVLQELTELNRMRRELQATEARFKSFMDANAIGILFGDIYGGIYQVNDELLRIIGYTRQDFEAGQLRWDVLTPPEYLPLDMERIAEATQKGQCTPYEKEYICKDGSRVPVLVGYSLLGEAREESAAFILDLTPLKRVEADLQQRQLQFQQLAEAMPQVVWVADGAGEMEYVNPQGVEYTGLSLEQMRDRPLFQSIIHPSDVARVDEQWAIALQTQMAFQVEYRMRRASDGEYRWFLGRALPVGDTQGRLVRWYGTSTDIDDRKKVEESLYAALRRLNLHIENTPLGVVELNRDFRVTRWSQSAERIFGWTATEVVGKKFGWDWDFVYEEDEAQVFRVMQQLTSGNTRHVVSCNRNYTKLGAIVHCEWYNSVVLDESGRFQSLLALVLDVSDRTRLQQERDRILLQEQEARAQAEAANRVKDEFLTVLSHELRTPMNAILGWTRLLRTRKLSEARVVEALDTIERNARLQTQLIEDLLDISRILKGQLHLNVDQVQVSEAIAAALSTVQLAANAKGITITTEMEAVGAIAGDDCRIQQIIWNLLSNAIKFTPEGGQVKVRLRQRRAGSGRRPVGNRPPGSGSSPLPHSASLVEITISDTGRGIAPEFLPHVFDYFRQADSSVTRHFGGLGLGLAIVRTLVEMHGGTVSVESPGVGQGATFTVLLPLLPGKGQGRPGQAIAARLARADRAAVDGAALAGIRLLVVDDDPDSHTYLQFVLQEAGAQVFSALCALDGLEMLAQVKPDVLISDIGMPNIDGYTLMRQVRQLPVAEGGGVPAIALTAYAGEYNQQQALKAGFQRHLSKPVELEVLVQAIAALVPPAQRRGSEV